MQNLIKITDCKKVSRQEKIWVYIYFVVKAKTFYSEPLLR